jgi:hypothetical protein
MYGKLFGSMYDGTLTSKGPWQALVTLQQMIILADRDGVVDMTASAISRRTSIPLDIIETGIAALMEPDPDSRTPDEDGRRIVLLESHRDWGWHLVNHAKYQAIRTAEERREYMRQAQARSRANRASTSVNNVNNVNQSQPQSTPTDTDIDADTDTRRRNTPRKREPAAPAVTLESLCMDGLAEDLAIEWLAHRKRKRAVLTPRAWEQLKGEIAKTGLSLDDAIAKALARGWTGFDASWLASDAQRQSGNNPAEPYFVRERREKIAAMTGGRMGVKSTQPKETIDVDVKRLD